jgi:hypothetical protein
MVPATVYHLNFSKKLNNFENQNGVNTLGTGIPVWGTGTGPNYEKRMIIILSEKTETFHLLNRLTPRKNEKCAN